MGKHKDDYDEYGYSKAICKQSADQLEEYIDAVETIIIINDKPKKKVKKAIKVVKKAIKDLREGRPEEVFNHDNYMEYMSNKDG